MNYHEYIQIYNLPYNKFVCVPPDSWGLETPEKTRQLKGVEKLWSDLDDGIMQSKYILKSPEAPRKFPPESFSTPSPKRNKRASSLDIQFFWIQLSYVELIWTDEFLMLRCYALLWIVVIYGFLMFLMLFLSKVFSKIYSKLDFKQTAACFLRTEMQGGTCAW